MAGWSTMDRDEDIAVKKAAMRAMMNSSRRSLPEVSRVSMSRMIAGYVVGMPEIVNARHIHLYLSIADQAEVSTAPLLDELAAMGKILSVPVIRKSDLLTAVFRQGEALKTAQFGQPEPEVVVLADESQLDVVLLPLLAFDRRGYRIGYGKGFYDRFLSRLAREGIHPFRVGLAFTSQMVEEVPADLWDESLDGVVHEQGIIRFT